MKKDLLRSTKHTHKTKDRLTRTPLKTEGWHCTNLWKEEGWAHTTSLSLCSEVLCQSRRMWDPVFLLLKILILPLPTIFLLDFGTVPIVRFCFLFFSFFPFYHFYRLKKSTLIEEMKICRNTDLWWHIYTKHIFCVIFCTLPRRLPVLL